MTQESYEQAKKTVQEFEDAAERQWIIKRFDANLKLGTNKLNFRHIIRFMGNVMTLLMNVTKTPTNLV